MYVCIGSWQSHLKIMQKHWGRYNGNRPLVPSSPVLIKSEFVPDCVLNAEACGRVNSRLRYSFTPASNDGRDRCGFISQVCWHQSVNSHPLVFNYFWVSWVFILNRAPLASDLKFKFSNLKPSSIWTAEVKRPCTSQTSQLPQVLVRRTFTSCREKHTPKHFTNP